MLQDGIGEQTPAWHFRRGDAAKNNNPFKIALHIYE